MNNGWIAVHRKILDNPVLNRSRKFSNFEAWMYLLLKANHKDNKVLLGNVLVNVKNGEMITSLKKLGSRFKWANTKLRAFLKLIESEQMIVVKSDTQKTQITICNYDKLQINENSKKISKTHQKHIKNTQTTMYNNVNNNNTNIVDRENKFKNEVIKCGQSITPVVPQETIDKFCDYWTERNKSGSKMLFELNKTWDTNRRLRRWVDSDFNKSKIVPKEKYKSNGRGEFKVWCAKCGNDLYYKEYHIKQQISTSCCGADFKAEKL